MESRIMRLGLIIEREQAWHARTQQGGIGNYIPPCWAITVIWPSSWLTSRSRTFRFGGLN